jgi:hypothetical protein
MVEGGTTAYPRAMTWWKWVGLAGVLGVTATGVAIARDERTRDEYTPDDVRARLRARAAQAGDPPEAAHHV